MERSNIDDNVKNVEKFYESFLAFTESIFSLLTDKNELDYNSVQRKINQTIDIVRSNRNLMVYVMQTAKKWKNPHVSHAGRSCLIALIIGIEMKLTRNWLVELGIAGLLCNIGVLKLSDWIYTKRKGGFNLLNSGTEYEQKLLFVHPIHAHKTLKSFGFPLPICEAVLHHHELEDGTGFPQGLKGDGVCFYGKVLSVAGYYEAFSTDETAIIKNGHEGMINILKNNGRFDASVIRALINSISVYPIGIHVLLSDGRHGQVVGLSPENPRFPIVNILGKKHNKAVQTSGELSVARPLTVEEIGLYGK